MEESLIIPKKYKHYARAHLKNAVHVSKQQTADNEEGPLEKPMVGLKLDTDTDLYIKQPPATSSKNGTSVPGRKSLLPTPPGSPEDAFGWPSTLDRSEPSTIAGAPPFLGPTDLDLPPSVPKPLALSDMTDANLSTAQSRLRLFPPFPSVSIVSNDLGDGSVIARALASSNPKRTRGEKKPIPEEQKDNKYFERRKRNNMAAKKSRDARKCREDQIALRANLLEKENAILRAQVATLREEAHSLRQLLIQKRNNRSQQ